MRVGERVPLPVADEPPQSMIVHKPDGSTRARSLPRAAFFDETDQPGLYTIDTRAGASSFAVNLDPLESKTAPLPSRRSSSSVFVWRTIPGRTSTASSFGRCTTPSWKAARNSGDG